MQESEKRPEKKESALLNIALNVALPALIMTKLSAPEYLGETWSLMLALSLPLGYGIYDYIQRRKINFFSILGLFSVVMTGGIGLFKLSRNWMIAKETIVPLIMGLAVIATQNTRFSLVRLFFDQMMDLDKIKLSFAEKAQASRFDQLLGVACMGLGLSFLISAALNFYLATTILVGEPGTVEFTESLGRMTALSFPVIVLPMMIMMGAILFYFFRTIHRITEKPFEEFLRQP